MSSTERYNTVCGRSIQTTRGNIFSKIASKMGINTKKCTFFSMCQACRQRRSKLCNNYHLYKKHKLILALQYYFPKLPRNVIVKMYKIAVGNLERELRFYYETMYIIHKDNGHSYFVNNTLPKSFTYENDVALQGNKFWNVVLYTAIVKLYEKDFSYIARNRLNSIIDTDTNDRNIACNVWNVSLQDDLNLSSYDVDYYNIFLEFFTLYLNNNTYINVNFTNIYNIDTYIDLSTLFLIDSCKMLLAAIGWPITYLFDDIIYVEYTDEHYILRCFIDSIFESSIYVKIKYNYDIRHTSYEYLDLMVSDETIQNSNCSDILIGTYSSEKW